MATFTPYLNLEKPTTSERLDVLKINSNWDKIDAGVSALNSQINNNATMPENANFNDYETPGSFYFASAANMTNPPKSNSGYGLLIVFGYKSGNYVRIMQMCITSGYHLYVRRHVGTTTDSFSEWREIPMNAIT